MTSRWRRWTFPVIYAAAIALSIALRGRNPVVLAVYTATLPWSAFASRLTSVALSWSALCVSALLNGAIAWIIGYHLDPRADNNKGAV